MPRVTSLLRALSIPQCLLIASALVYGGSFALLLAWGRPGLGLGGLLYLAVILAATGSSPGFGLVAGGGAFFLYELAIHHAHGGLTAANLTAAPALTHLGGYAAAGLLTGFLAQRGRLMLAESFHVLDELIELAHGRLADSPIEAAAVPPAQADSQR